MKSILIAALTVGATVAGLILYLESKSKSRRALPDAVNNDHSAPVEDKVQSLAFHSIP